MRRQNRGGEQRKCLEKVLRGARQPAGNAGFAQMAKDGTGGWQLTVDTYARGGRMEDGKKATLTNAQTKASLQFLKDLRWTDNAMGANFD